MKYPINDISLIKVVLTDEEKAEAKAYAKAQGFTFQGWVGRLIRRELADARKEKAQGAGGGEE